MAESNGHGKPRFVKSIETQLIEERLKKATVGEVIEYEELSKLASVDVRRGRGYGAIRSARESLWKNDGIEFGVVVNVGLRRLDEGERGDVASAAVVSIRRKASRVMRKAANIDRSKLTPEQRTKLDTTFTVVATVSHFSSAPAVKKIGEAVAKSQQQLPLRKTLEFFS